MVPCRDCGLILSPGDSRCRRCGQFTANPIPKAGAITSAQVKEKDLIDAMDVQAQDIARILTNTPFDSVWGGGFVPTTCTLLGGAPGLGKTTMLLQLAVIFYHLTQKPSYYISAEQHKGALKMTIDRMELPLERGMLRMLDTQSGGGSIDEAVLRATPPGMIILDSVSALCGNNKHEQVAVCKQYIKYGVNHKCKVFLIAHMTKEHDYAGLMALQHEVDTLVTIEHLEERKANQVLRKIFGEKRMRQAMYSDEEDTEIEQFLGNIRALTPWKNRYGPTGQQYYFSMTSKGLIGLPDPPKEEKRQRLAKAVGDDFEDEDEEDDEFEDGEDERPARVAKPKPRAVRAPTKPETIEVNGQKLVRKPRPKKDDRAAAIEGEALKKKRPPMPKKKAKKTSKAKVKEKKKDSRGKR